MLLSMCEYVLADTIQKHINRYVNEIEAIRDKDMQSVGFVCEADKAKILRLQYAGMALVELARDAISEGVFKDNIAWPVDWKAICL